MASIFKTTAGTYRVKISIPVNGKYKQMTKSGFRTKTEAKAWAAQMEAHKFDNEERTSHALLKDYFDRWVSIYKTDLAPATIEQYKITSNAIGRYLPNVTIDNFERSSFQRFINIYGETRAKETVNKRKVHIAQALRDAYAEGLIKRDPTIRIKTVGHQGKSKDLKFLEFEELQKLEKYSFDHVMISESYLAIIIAIHTGMRIGEILALSPESINYDDQIIIVDKAIDAFNNIRKPKTENSIRNIKVDLRLLGILKSTTSDSDKRIISVNAQKIRRDLIIAIKETGIKPITFHALRHSHASYLLSRGIAVQYVSERLGHANVAITQEVYAHLLETLRTKEEQKSIKLLGDINN